MERGRFVDVEGETPYSGVIRRSFDSERATVVNYRFAPGASFPPHHHPQEQITLVEEGSVEFTVGGEVSSLAPGDWAVVAPDVDHGLRAGPAGAVILAVLSPRRQAANEYTLL